MRRSPADSTNRSLAAFGKLQHIPFFRSSPRPQPTAVRHETHEYTSPCSWAFCTWSP